MDQNNQYNYGQNGYGQDQTGSQGYQYGYQPQPPSKESVYGQQPSLGRAVKIITVLVCLFAAAAIALTAIFPPNARRTVPFDEMVYERPDAGLLCEKLEELTAMVEDGAAYSAVRGKYTELEEAVADYRTMQSINYIQYAMDTTDEKARSEMDFFDENGALVQQKLDALHYAVAGSSLEKDLERDFYSEGFFDDYRGDNLFDDEVAALKQRESELVSSYYDLMSEPTVSLDGKEMSVSEVIGLAQSQSIGYDEYIDAIKRYYEKYSETAGEIYVELIKTRNQIAKKLDYESYAHYAFKNFGRDYTPADANRFCETVKDQLVPLQKQMYADGTYAAAQETYSASESRIWDVLESSSRVLGGKIEESFDFMKKYSLADLSQSDVKIAGSFTTYIFNYDAPFMTVNADGTTDSLITAAHEFGHFTDNYINRVERSDLDVAETLSQSMEFIILSAASEEIGEKKADFLINSNLVKTLGSICIQCAYHEFENEIYAMDDGELSVDALNAAGKKCFAGAYPGFAGMEDILSMSWFEINHFFEQPFYTVSYGITAAAALQVYTHVEKGDAAQIYLDIALGSNENDGDPDYTELLLSVGLKNPLDAGTVSELKELLSDPDLKEALNR